MGRDGAAVGAAPPQPPFERRTPLQLRANFSTYWTPELEWFHPIKFAQRAHADFFDGVVAKHGWHDPVYDLDAPDVRAKLKRMLVLPN